MVISRLSSPQDMKTVRASWCEKERIHHWLHVNIATEKSIHHGPHSASPNSHHFYTRGSIDIVFLLLPALQFAPPNCAGADHASVSAHFSRDAVCDRREVLQTVSGSRRVPVMIWVIFSLISAAFPPSNPDSPSTPIPTQVVGGLILEQDKLFPPLRSRLQTLSCRFSRLASGHCKQ